MVVGLAIPALFVLLVAGGYIAIELLDDDYGRPFDSAEWKKWGGNRSCDGESPRFAMVDDLQRHHLKFGMERQKVAALIGDPAPERRSIEFGLGGSIDCEFLALDFSRRNRLVSVVQYQG